MLCREQARRPRPKKVMPIEDYRFPPLWIERGPTHPTTHEQPPTETALPTDAQLKQQKLKVDKEAGIKPRRKPKKVERVDAERGEDLKGLGCYYLFSDALDI